MKKVICLALFLCLAATVVYAADYPKLTVTGKIYTYLTLSENNMDDFASYDASDSLHWAATNDQRTYAQARVDLNFGIDVAPNVFAKISTRWEGKSGADEKWMYFGKYSSSKADDNGNPTRPQMKDAVPTLQEAYVELKKLCNQPLTLDFGRKTENFGAPGEKNYGNVMSTGDKVDGLKLNYSLHNYYGNLHYYIMENQGDVEAIEGERNDNIIGLNAGVKDLAFLKGINAYMWMRSKTLADAADSTNDVKDGVVILGFRADMSFLNDMITPYFEVATQSGSNDLTKVDYAGSLIDVGADFSKEVGPVTLDGGIRYLMPSGDDADTADKNETFTGIGLSNWEEGWKLLNPVKENMNMLKFTLGATPAAMDKLWFGFSFWNYSNPTTNIEGLSGEAIMSEIGVSASYAMNDNVYVMLGYNMITPNKDVMNLEFGDGIDHADAATALWFETDVRW
jgi:hypothetical protein